MASNIKRRDSKEARNIKFTREYRDNIKYSSFVKYGNSKAREWFKRKPYGKVGETIGKSGEEKN